MTLTNDLIEHIAVESGDSRVAMRAYIGHKWWVDCFLEVKNDFGHGHGLSNEIFFLSGSSDIRLWNAETAVCVSVFREHQSDVSCFLRVPFHSSLILSGSYDESIALWLHKQNKHNRTSTPTNNTASESSTPMHPDISFVRRFETNIMEITTLCSMENGWIVSGSRNSWMRLWKFWIEDDVKEAEIPAHTRGVSHNGVEAGGVLIRWDLNEERVYGDPNSGFLAVMIELWPNFLVLCTPKSRLECWDFSNGPAHPPKRMNYQLSNRWGHSCITKLNMPPPSVRQQHQSGESVFSATGGCVGYVDVMDNNNSTCVVTILCGADVNTIIHLKSGELLVATDDSMSLWNLQQRFDTKLSLSRLDYSPHLRIQISLIERCCYVVAKHFSRKELKDVLPSELCELCELQKKHFDFLIDCDRSEPPPKSY